MLEVKIDAIGANENPATPAAKAASKPVKRGAESKTVKVSAQAVTAAPDTPAKPTRAAAAARAVKPSKAGKTAAAVPVKRAKSAKVTKPAALPEVGLSQPKPKLVRDSFTIPELEYTQLEALKRRALALAHHAKKSELLRAGIATLAAMDDARLLAALQSVPSLKTGRPKKAKADKAVVKARNGGKKS
jgi:hypothetical protein